MTEPTPEEITIHRSGNGPQRGLPPALDPATGARIISPERDRIIRETLRREARRVTLRLLFCQPRFEIEYLLLKLRYKLLRIFRRFAGDLPQRSDADAEK